MRDCDICGKPVTLSPTAAERAAKSGNPASYYTNLFRTHSDCELKKRADETSALMYQLNKEYEAKKALIRRVPKPT